MNRELIQLRNAFPRFPTVVNSRTFDNLWDSFFKDFDSIERATEGLFGTNQVVPYDVKQIKENGKLIGTEISYALAGFSPEEINVEIDETNDTVTIKAEKLKQPEYPDKYEYVRKGIAHRSIQVSYHLDKIDKEKITASFKDGVLNLFLPLEEEKSKLAHVRKLNLIKG